MSWTVLVPVKRLDIAKSRLRGTVTPDRHVDLVLAMAMDTVAAALASEVVWRVAVVTSDQRARRAALDTGAQVLADLPEAGINPALEYAVAQVRAGGGPPGVAALAADVPALRSGELSEALRRVDGLGPGGRRAYVADTAGSGTVLLAAAPGIALAPRFGAGSAAAHTASGAVPLTGAWPSLRRDVDTAADLAQARTLGLGPRTSAVVATGGVGDENHRRHGTGARSRGVAGLPRG